MTSIEIISNHYHNMVTKKIYEIISLTYFYYNEMNWSFYNIKHYFKNIKYIIIVYFIIFFDYILIFIFLFIIYNFIWKN